MYELFFYENRKGESQVDDFLDKLQSKIRAKVEK